jgi:hypothetical protein
VPLHMSNVSFKESAAPNVHLEMNSYVDHEIVEKVFDIITFLQHILFNNVHSSFYEDIFG